jgi:signal transduction histidine kinase
MQRIAQNLILNALKYTEKGGVVVSCAQHPGEVERWSFCVQDTGVGLERLSGTPLAEVIHAATEEANSVERNADVPAPTLPSQSADGRHAGEGIGLSIVKRLCELLDASIELETQRGCGTTFRIVFPARYG